MASYKDYKTVSAAQKAGSMYFIGKDGKKKLAVTAEQLKAWKKKNKGKFKGSALTAWANAKGKDLKGAVTTSLRPKTRPVSKKTRPELDRGKRDPDNPKVKNIEVRISEKKEKLKKSLQKRTSPEALRIRQELRDLEEELKNSKPTGNKTAMKFGKAAVKKAPTPNTSGKPGSRSGLAKGGMMKKKGYAKGGMMKKKGYAKGGVAKKSKK